MALDFLRSVQRREGREYVFGIASRGFSGWGWHVLKLNARIIAARGNPLEDWRLHDLRRSMRTGLGKLGIAPHIAELCINHVKGGVQAIYDRYTYLPQIGAALAAWAVHVEMITGEKSDKVTALRA
jgi:hypothetical protein